MCRNAKLEIATSVGSSLLFMFLEPSHLCFINDRTVFFIIYFTRGWLFFVLSKISNILKLGYNNIMNEIIPTDEYTEIEGRYYANPQIALDRSRNFIDNLRATQAQRNEQIAKDTAALGTEVSSNLGGLGGGTDYWTARLSTPQTNSAVANLRATAQAAALNQALENEQAIWKKRYQDAYRAYQKRQNDKTNTPQSPSTTGPSNLGIDVNSGDSGEGGANENTTTTGPGYVTSVQGGLNIYTDQSGGKWTLRNLQGGDETLLGGLTSVGGNLLRTFPDGTPLTNGAVYNAGGGRVFMYVQNSQYPNGSFFRVGDSPTMSYR